MLIENDTESEVMQCKVFFRLIEMQRSSFQPIISTMIRMSEDTLCNGSYVWPDWLN